jgi:hypothetical protein
MVNIRFKAQGANSVIGSFSSGDIANVSETFARHLVEEARVAEYLKAGEPAKPAKPAKAAKKPRQEAAAVPPAPTSVEAVATTEPAAE